MPFAAPSADAALADASEAERLAEENDDAKTDKFVNALTGITLGVKGLLRAHTRKHGKLKGRIMKPFCHQRRLVKRMLAARSERMIVNHAAGLGKTYSFLLFVAARYTLSKGNMPKVLITAPTSCVQQWYDAVLDTLRISPTRILKTTRQKDMHADAIDSHDIIITSRDMIGNAARKTFVWVTAHHQNDRGNWLSAYDRREGTTLHPLFAAEFDIVGFDEVHAMRNSLAYWTFGHSEIAKKAGYAVGISATLIMNKPDDLRGIATSLAMPSHFREKTFWYVDRRMTSLNVDAIKQFATYVDTVGEEVLNLPTLTHEIKSFPAGIAEEHVDAYNTTLAQARRLRVSMARGGRYNREAHIALLGHLQRLQQFLVSPVIAEHGADELQRSAETVKSAALEDTGALRALKQEIQCFNNQGYMRVIVACNHTSMMAVARAYLDNQLPECGTLLTYSGSLSQTQRSQVPEMFLTAPRSVLFLSIEAGGTGLHLCPGCEAVIFWGSRPFSPMQVLQTTKRVHRIGQENPVKVVHLIADGSVDFAINKVHADKQVLANSIYDTDELELKQGRWRTTGRIVDSCTFLNKGGNFEAGITEAQIETQFATPQTAPPPGPPLAWVPQFQMGGLAGTFLAQAAAHATAANGNVSFF